YCGSKVPPRDLIFEILLGLLFAGTLALHGSIDAAVVAALTLEVLLLGLSLADWDSGVIPDGFLAAILVVWIMTVGFRPDAQQFAIEGVIASACVGLLMAVGTAIVGKIAKAKVSYGTTKLAMCMMLFLGFRGSVIAVIVGIVLGILFALVCKSKKRKMSLAPAISLAFIAAFILKDLLVVLGVQIPL
ncbi:MAG: prepilin peptidase, partial [Clostridiales bacterium]|nr:prepilin peptidase [Clostridiales bacterium]